MPVRQQRRRTAPPAGASFPLFPQLYYDWVAIAVDPHTIRLANPAPFMVNGVPAVLLNSTEAPTSINILSNVAVDFTFASTLAPNSAFTIPEWCLGLRGLNGEYFGPRTVGINSDYPGTHVIWILEVISTGGNNATARFSEDVSILSTPAYFMDLGPVVVSASPGVTPNLVDLVFDSPVSPYADFMNIPPGDTSIQGVGTFFPAPARLFML